MQKPHDSFAINTESGHTANFVLDKSIINDKIESVVGKSLVPGGKKEFAALEAQIIAQDAGKIIAGVGHCDPINDIARLTNTYGGDASQWVKMTSKDLNRNMVMKNGEVVELNWYQNLSTGLKVESKVKITNKKK